MVRAVLAAVFVILALLVATTSSAANNTSAETAQQIEIDDFQEPTLVDVPVLVPQLTRMAAPSPDYEPPRATSRARIERPPRSARTAL